MDGLVLRMHEGNIKVILHIKCRVDEKSQYVLNSNINIFSLKLEKGKSEN